MIALRPRENFPLQEFSFSTMFSSHGLLHNAECPVNLNQNPHFCNLENLLKREKYWLPAFSPFSAMVLQPVRELQLIRFVTTRGLIIRKIFKCLIKD